MRKIRLTLNAVILGILFAIAFVPMAIADVYINVMALNGAAERKETTVKFNLPGDLTAEDILETDGLQLEYNPNDANYVVRGAVALAPKESKTFKIRVRDVWKVSSEDVEAIKKEIDEGYDRLGKVHDPQNAELLRTQLKTKLDYIINLQAANSDSIEKRIDSYRTYSKEVKRIHNDALSVDFWRSDSAKVEQPKLIRFIVEVENPSTNPKKMVKEKEYLPGEVKPEHVVEAEGFEVRFDQQKQLSFLFKEEELESGQKKRYSIGILDMWSIQQRMIDYLRTRTNYAYDFLKNSKFKDSADILVGRIESRLKSIEASQAQPLPILEHISAFRKNKKEYGDAEHDVEELEKLLSVLREDLEKSKVKNVLGRIKSLKSVGDVSKAVFNKKLQPNTAWTYMGWIVLFIGILTLLTSVVWVIRSKDKKITGDPKDTPKKP
jgi:hypothetical protein